MTPWQVVKQVRYLLRARKWEGNGAFEVVFPDVHVTNGMSDEAAANLRFPMSLIHVLDCSSNGEDPDKLTQNLGVTIAVALAGDQIGENAVLGANRVAASFGVNTSRGRGILEVEEELVAVFRQLQDQNGIRIYLRHRSDIETTTTEQDGYVAKRWYSFEVGCTDTRYYHPPQNLVATPIGGGQVTLTWALAPDRYDRYTMVVRRAAGSTPPATPSSGTSITISGPTAVTVTDTPGVGTFSYAIFTGYDETAVVPANSQRASAQEIGTTRTVVVT